MHSEHARDRRCDGDAQHERSHDDVVDDADDPDAEGNGRDEQNRVGDQRVEEPVPDARSWRLHWVEQRWSSRRAGLLCHRPLLPLLSSGPQPRVQPSAAQGCLAHPWRLIVALPISRSHVRGTRAMRALIRDGR